MHKVWLLGDNEKLLSALENEIRQVPDILCERWSCANALSWHMFELSAGSLLPSLMVLDSALAVAQSNQILKRWSQSEVWTSIPRVVVTEGAVDNRFCTDCYAFGASGYAAFSEESTERAEAIKIFVQYWLRTSLLPYIYTQSN